MTLETDHGETKRKFPVYAGLEITYPIVVIKLVVNDPSENRKRRQLLPTPAVSNTGTVEAFSILIQDIQDTRYISKKLYIKNERPLVIITSLFLVPLFVQ